MLIPGYKKYKEPTKSKGYDTENETFCKYGKEIRIHDYVQAGKDGTEASQVIASAGGIEQLKAYNANIPTSDIEFDLNMDPYIANQIVKIGKIAQEKLDREAKIQEELAKINETINTPKGGEE